MPVLLRMPMESDIVTVTVAVTDTITVVNMPMRHQRNDMSPVQACLLACIHALCMNEFGNADLTTTCRQAWK